MPPNTVKVARPTRWGNPFKIDWPEGGKDAAWAVSAFRGANSHPSAIARIKQELRGKNLACFCKVIDECGNYVPCHADILLAVANGMTQDEVRHENLKANEGRQK